MPSDPREAALLLRSQRALVAQRRHRADASVDRLLAEIDADPTGIFGG
jgi:hypothetical protein